MERCTSHLCDTWSVPWLAPVVLRASISADLLDRRSWVFSSELPFCEIIPGFKNNQLALEFFGIPFYGQQFPFANHVGSQRLMHPMGWLETNIVRIQDSNHIWYDPFGRTLHLFMRANTGLAGYGALAKVIEHSDGRMSVSIESAPSGKKMLFIPLPGGHLRFHIIYDCATQYYWLLGNQSFNSMHRVDALEASWHGLPNNDRSRLVLHFSKNLWDWCFAGLLWVEKGAPASISYASMDIDGEDLVVLARYGDCEAWDTRTSNHILYMRVSNFRTLSY